MVFFNDPVRRAPTSFSEGPRGVGCGSAAAITSRSRFGAERKLMIEFKCFRFCPLNGHSCGAGTRFAVAQDAKKG